MRELDLFNSYTMRTGGAAAQDERAVALRLEALQGVRGQVQGQEASQAEYTSIILYTILYYTII